MRMPVLAIFSVLAFCSLTLKAGTYVEKFSDNDHKYSITYTATGNSTAELTKISITESWTPFTLEIPQTVIIDGEEMMVTSIGSGGLQQPDGFSEYEYMPEEIILPETITKISDHAFSKNTRLKTINLPSGITEIGDYAFFKNTSLQSVNLPDELTTIGKNVFAECSSLRSLTFPKKLEIINEWICKNCQSLSEITIGENTTWIYDHAFDATSDATIPPLRAVYCNAVTPPQTDDYVFNESCTATVYVPYGTQEAYVADWGKKWASLTFVEMNDGQTSVITDVSQQRNIVRLGTETVALSGDAGTIYTIEGKRVVDFSIPETTAIKLPAGVYIIRTTNESLKVIVH